MYYRVRKSDGRITVSSPTPLVATELFDVVQLADETAYNDLKNTYRYVNGVVEVDPTYTPPEYQVSTKELQAIVAALVKELNTLREELRKIAPESAEKLSDITAEDLRVSIKDALSAAEIVA